jgi:hypothetical protein
MPKKNDMKKLILLVTIATYCLTVSAQDNTNMTPSNNKRLFLSANFSSDLCYRSINTNDTSSLIASIVKDRNANEVIKFGFTTGLNISYFINDNFAIELGCQFSDKGYNRKWTDALLGGHIDPRYGFDNDTTNVIKKMKINYHIYYIDIPLTAKYFIGHKKIRLITGLGFTTNIYLNEINTGVLKYANGDKDRQSGSSYFDYKKIDLSPFASIGVTYKMSDKMMLAFEPTFRYGILKIIDTPITGNLWNCGLNLSYYYKI